MGCNTQCKCQFNWPVDTLGLKRDPISSEKAWLDYAVRLLSREASGRGKGQESVWGAACKPAWWDSEVGLVWKNPTANPKDTKATLQKKYEALEKHLRAEDRFPHEMEEESRLWSAGSHKELYLLTSLTSLLGRVSGVHSAAVETKFKSRELKAEIGNSLLQDIKTCLSATLREIDNIENVDHLVTRKRKTQEVEVDIAPRKTARNEKNTIDLAHDNYNCKQLQSNIASEITNLSSKLLDKHRQVKRNTVVPISCKQVKSTPPKNPAVFSTNQSSAVTNTVIYVTNSLPTVQLSSEASNSFQHSIPQPVASNMTSDKLSSEIVVDCQKSLQQHNTTHVQKPITHAYPYTNSFDESENTLQNVICDAFVHRQSEKEALNKQNIDFLINLQSTSNGTIDNSDKSPSRLSVDSEASTISLKHSDHGYNSDENPLDFLDDFLNSEESSEILESDSTAFLENYLNDFEGL